MKTNEKPGVSVCIATHNRAAELRKTLESVAALRTAPSLPFEVLVVANDCSDSTRDVVREFQRIDGQRFRCVDEPVPGLSKSRNRAVAEARFDLVAFLDDDVDVDPNWLLVLWESYKSSESAAIGGRAYLIYPSHRPKWLNEQREGLLTKVELGDAPRDALADELYGLNLSIRKSWFDRVGTFRTDLGRVGTCLLGSEESELLARVANAGGRLVYEPRAVVGHRVPAYRLRRRWFWQRIYWGHVGEMRIATNRDISGKNGARYALWIGEAVLTAGAALFRRGPHSEEFFEHSMIVAARVGALVGLLDRLLRKPFSRNVASTQLS